MWNWLSSKKLRDIKKPFDPDILRAKVLVFAELWRRGRLIELQRAALAEQLESIAPIAEALQHAADRGDVTQPIAESAKAALVDKQLALLALEQACAEQRLALVLSVGHSLTDADSKS